MGFLLNDQTNAMMDWSRTAPSMPGYYWVSRSFSDGTPSDAEVVLLDEANVVHFFREHEIGQPASATYWLSWYPQRIEPPSP